MSFLAIQTSSYMADLPMWKIPQIRFGWLERFVFPGRGPENGEIRNMAFIWVLYGFYMVLYGWIWFNMVYGQCRNYRTEVEEDEGTVIYRTLLFYNSVFLGRYEKKNVSDLPPTFFRRSIILVGALLFYNSVFPHLSHISHFRSIINFPWAPFYN